MNIIYLIFCIATGLVAGSLATNLKELVAYTALAVIIDILFLIII